MLGILEELKMTDSEMIAQFLAQKGVTKVAPEKRAEKPSKGDKWARETACKAVADGMSPQEARRIYGVKVNAHNNYYGENYYD